MVESEGENAEGFLGRRVDAAEAGEQLAGRPVRVDARGVLRAEQVLEGGVRGDPLHEDVKLPPGIPLVEDDRVADADVALVRGGHPYFDRLAPCFHLAVVPPEQAHVVLVSFVSGRRARDGWERLLGVVRHTCLRSMLSDCRGCGVATGHGAVAALRCFRIGVGGEEVDESVGRYGSSIGP